MPSFIDVVVYTESGRIELGKFHRPLRMEDIIDELARNGHPRPATLFPRPPGPKVYVEVVNGPSALTPAGWQINVDQPLLQFYHQYWLSKVPAKPSSDVLMNHWQDKVIIGNVEIQFHRTIRVPDNDVIHSLPPSMGTFELFNVAQHYTQLPQSVIHTGGIFLSMYQREALWISFKKHREESDSAVKISVGGINALTGLKQNEISNGKQDYVAVNGTNGQLWLDGISIGPGIIRQFVAIPLGQGYTVEGQLTGFEDMGGIQIDVFPETRGIQFQDPETTLSGFESPRKQGIRTGKMIQIVFLYEDQHAPPLSAETRKERPQ